MFSTAWLMLIVTINKDNQMKKLQNNQSGIALVAAVVLIVVIVAVGFVGWKVWDKNEETKSNGTSNSSTSDKDTASSPTKNEVEAKEKSATLTGNVSFIKDNEPSGWIEEHQEGSKIYSLNNDQLGCYVSVSAEEPNQAAGWSWPPTDKARREAVFGSGQKVDLYEMGQAKIYSTSEGHIIKDGFDIVVNVSCQDKLNFPVADLALKGIRVE